jgi:hypothetical protein
MVGVLMVRCHATALAAAVHLDDLVQRHLLLKRLKDAHPNTSPSVRNASSATSTSKTTGRCETKRRSYSRSARTSARGSTIPRCRDRSSRRARNTLSRSELVLYNVSGAITLESFHRVIRGGCGAALFPTRLLQQQLQGADACSWRGAVFSRDSDVRIVLHDLAPRAAARTRRRPRVLRSRLRPQARAKIDLEAPRIGR